MNIPPAILKAHRELGTTNLQFIDYVGNKSDALNASSYRGLELHDKLFVLQPWPTFIDQKTKNQMKEASIKVFNLIKSIPRKVFDNDYDEISDFYGIPRSMVKYFLESVTDENIDDLFARGDFILTREGLKCLEYNVNTNLGGLQLPSWEARYLSLPVVTDFLKKHNVSLSNVNVYDVMFEHLTESALKRSPNEPEVNVAVMLPDFEITSADGTSPQSDYYNTIYQNVLKRYEGLSGQVMVCAYSHLNVSNGSVYRDNHKIHVIVEWYQGFVPGEILEVSRQGNISIFNGGIAWLLSAKSNLALLSQLQDADMFSDEEKEVIKKHIPWTRRVISGETSYNSEQVDLKSFMLENREKLVLKPVLGYGGKDIHIGRFTADAEWRELVEAALKPDNWQDLEIGDRVTIELWQQILRKALSVKSWIVQEYEESNTYFYQWGDSGYAEHSVVWGYFVFGNRYAGSWVRAMPRQLDQGIINCHQGAKVSVVFEVDEGTGPTGTVHTDYNNNLR